MEYFYICVIIIFVLVCASSINEAYHRMYDPQIVEIDSTRPVKDVVNNIFDIVKNGSKVE